MNESSKRLLSALMVLGAQSPERALSVDELAGRLGVGAPEVESELKQLVEAGYARTVRQAGTSKVYLTGTGIITASSTYS
jgi:DNA-binding IclR family transcriptional regulator